MRRSNHFILFVFILASSILIPSRLFAACGTRTRSCPKGGGGHCVGDAYYAYSGVNTSCSKTPYSCNCRACNCDEYGCDTCCNTCCADCTPPACPESNQSQDVDGDGYTDQCTDCDPGNKLVNPGSPNTFCDCNASDTYGATTGIQETTGCLIDDMGIHFTAGCLCLDGKDNDCDGKIDFADSDCPDPALDWIIATAVTLDYNKTINGGVYVTSSGSLTIVPGVTLTIDKGRGLKIEPGGFVDPDSQARIQFR